MAEHNAPIAFHRHNRTMVWLEAGFRLAAMLLLWAMAVAEGRSWLMYFYLFMVPDLVLMFGRRGAILSAGVLTILQNGGLSQVVPLSSLRQAERSRDRLRLRWLEGRVGRVTSFKAPPDFLDAVEGAIAAARAAEPGSLPLTAKEAGKQTMLTAVAPPPLPFWLHVAGWSALAILFGLAVWLNQPLFLLPVVPVPWLMDRPNRMPLLCLDPTGLYLVPVGGEVRLVPTETIQAVSLPRPRALSGIQTAEYGFIRLSGFGAAELTRELKRRLEGSADAGGQSSGSKLRCLLCGRLAPEAGNAAPQHDPAADAPVYICPACSGRTRYEASESGHGISPKETKPM